MTTAWGRRWGSKKQRRAHIRAKLYEAQDGLCVLCGEEMIEEQVGAMPSRRTATIEHLTPLDLGGRAISYDNLALSHYHCNTKRGTTPLTEEQLERVRYAHYHAHITSRLKRPVGVDP